MSGGESIVPQTGVLDDVLRMYHDYPYKTLIKSLLARKPANVITDGNSAMITWGPSVLVGGACSPFILDQLSAVLKNSPNERFLNFPDGNWMPHIARAVPGRFDEKRINMYMADAIDDAYVQEDSCIIPVDAAFLESGLENAQTITDELYSYLSLEDFCQTGYGLALVKNHAVCGYCLSEYSIDGECGINIWIDEKYRGLGYAKAMTKRFLAHSQQERWRVFWGCFADNTASNHLAQTCGFKLHASQRCWVWKKL